MRTSSCLIYCHFLSYKHFYQYQYITILLSFLKVSFSETWWKTQGFYNNLYILKHDLKPKKILGHTSREYLFLLQNVIAANLSSSMNTSIFNIRSASLFGLCIDVGIYILLIIDIHVDMEM